MVHKERQGRGQDNKREPVILLKKMKRKKNLMTMKKRKRRNQMTSMGQQ
jgi:hypothetical protein